MDYDTLHEVLHYDPVTGVFTWNVQRHCRKAGDLAGTRRPDGYRHICFKGKLYLEHRLAWLYMTGNWPINQIDHIDNDRRNNKWTNLREATHSQNKMNTNIQTNNVVGYKGVHFNTTRKVFVAAIKKDGKQIFLGYFDNPSDAYAAYVQAASELHGKFANIGDAI